MLADKLIAIIGSGTMGRTIASGLLKSGKVKPSQVRATARTKASAEKVAKELSVVCTTVNAEAVEGADLVILCVKPTDVAKDDHIALATEVFAPLGRVLELEEKHMDTVTGLSASGPAFIYIIIEALADGGVMRGLPRNVATTLVAQMTLGAAEMVLTTGRHPAALKDDVTTPAGCTIAGILALEDGRIRSVLARGVETAARVAGELGK